ncbi:YicC family protein [Alsobacter sp. SYSU M60028]|uniref:YicC family protein n=1 Tax=Alsobacter ponti TaxID=2962936 RepID=A0ABT1LFJ7_9HYPH|nr:YicC/YloC family endoribonuclease [Alsobacter ponti]MCP8940261.1 YicC family protein [Alsobacter ponti]
MALSSMTGFARETGASGPWTWAWELKTVNAKGLDVRVRVPPALESIAEECRQRIGKAISRGTCFATLNATREAAPTVARVNTELLTSLVEALAPFDGRMGLRAPSVGDLLAVRGVVEVVEGAEDAGAVAAAGAAMLEGLDIALAALCATRLEEGRALAAILTTRIETIARLAAAADACPARKPEAIRARLAEQIATLVGASAGLDPNRLYQEAVLLASKADVREEIDRLGAHVAAARDLLAKGGPIGRRLDFLAQEFSREANTLCAKANDVSLTAIGLNLKTEVEQFREQVQNVE